MTRPLNPFDTGKRLEPKPWVRLAGGVWWAGSTEENSLRRAEDDDFGLVDFDNEESATELTVWVEVDEETGKPVVHVQPMGEDEIEVVVHDG